MWWFFNFRIEVFHPWFRSVFWLWAEIFVVSLPWISFLLQRWYSFAFYESVLGDILEKSFHWKSFRSCISQISFMLSSPYLNFTVDIMCLEQQHCYTKEILRQSLGAIALYYFEINSYFELLLNFNRKIVFEYLRREYMIQLRVAYFKKKCKQP